MRTIKHIVIHCTATPQNTTLESIQNYWKNVRGWKNPGYHFIVMPDGEVKRLLPTERIANGAKGFNRNSVHISYMGGVDDNYQPLDNRTIAQNIHLGYLIRTLKRLFPDAIVTGHRDLPGVTKACPSFDVESLLSTIIPSDPVKEKHV